jgi:GH24 family phage-related lysozyme (muramidase)
VTAAPPTSPPYAGLVMKPSALAAFRDFSTKFEGYLPYMYLDIKGLVTTGMGNLIDPIGAALELPWRRPDGSLATESEVRAAWNLVKARIDLAPKYGTAFAGLTTLRLDKAGIEQLIARKLRENEAYLRRRFPDYERWPADAQLGLHSMAWAMGPGFHFPDFDAAVNRPRPDFDAAARASHMDASGNPGLVPRNSANFQLFTNAARVLERGADPETLYWPGSLLAEVRSAVHGWGPLVALGLALGGAATIAAIAARRRAARVAAERAR